MLLQQKLAVFSRLEDRVKLLEVLEVDLVEGWSARASQTSKRPIKPSFRILQIINDLIFLFHLETVVFCGFLNNISQILHLFFIEGVSTFAFL